MCAGGLSIPWFDPSDQDSVLCLDPPRLSIARRFAVTLGCPYDHWFARRTEDQPDYPHFVRPGLCAKLHVNQYIGRVGVLPWGAQSCRHLLALALAVSDVGLSAKTA